MEPGYRRLHRDGALARRAEELLRGLADCALCAWGCRVDRLAGITGVCGAGALAEVCAFVPHFGEEPALSGTHLPAKERGGAGNIFFGRCNLRCAFCQNWQISRPEAPAGRAVDAARLAGIMLELERRGCHNIGLVSPSHVAAQVLAALSLAADRGLQLPLVWNSNAYDSLETLRALEGVVDIYLPDLKYSDDGLAEEFSRAPNYCGRAREAVKEMFRQVGDGLVLDQRGLLRRGLVIRLLVLPNNLAGIKDTLRWIRSALSPAVCLSVMSQYHPAGKPGERPPLLDRPLTSGEFARVLSWIDEFGFTNGWIQPFEDQAARYYQPDFADPKSPFKDAADFPAAGDPRPEVSPAKEKDASSPP